MARLRKRCYKCGAQLIPHHYSYLFDKDLQKAVSVCKCCHDRHIKIETKKLANHGNG